MNRILKYNAVGIEFAELAQIGLVQGSEIVFETLNYGSISIHSIYSLSLG
jgi:hypothetical protein